MKLFAAACASLVVAALPARATTYELTGVTDRPLDFGSVTIDPQGDFLDLNQACGTRNQCRRSGPWDSVSFDLVLPFQQIATGDADGDVTHLVLYFDKAGNVAPGSSFSFSGDAPDGRQLSGSFISGATGFTGTFIPDEFADPEPITLALTQVGDPVGARLTVPEPASFGLLAFGLFGLTAARYRSRW